MTKTAAGTLVAFAAFACPHADNLRNQALHRQAQAGMLSGERGQRATCSPDHVAAVLLDVRQRARRLRGDGSRPAFGSSANAGRR
jgi:hypothetical protein